VLLPTSLRHLHRCRRLSILFRRFRSKQDFISGAAVRAAYHDTCLFIVLFSNGFLSRRHRFGIPGLARLSVGRSLLSEQTPGLDLPADVFRGFSTLTIGFPKAASSRDKNSSEFPLFFLFNVDNVLFLTVTCVCACTYTQLKIKSRGRWYISEGLPCELLFRAFIDVKIRIHWMLSLPILVNPQYRNTLPT